MSYIKTSDVFNSVQQLPPDALFNLKARLSKDPRPLKVDLGIGAYRDNNGKPWVLPSVVKAEKLITSDPNYNHEYLGISGLPQLTKAAAKTIIGHANFDHDRIISVQSLSGTGALHIASKFLSIIPTTKSKTVYISDPTWINHVNIFENEGFKVEKYPYWDYENKCLNFDAMLSYFQSIENGGIILLHACAHNPTGMDPTETQWRQILDVMHEKDHFVLFDSAYQGFASGSLEKDAFAIRLAVNEKLRDSCLLICQSFAKNVGMYGERVGCFHVVLPEGGNPSVSTSVLSHLNKITRSEVSNPPAYGAKIVSTILTNEELTNQWHKDLITMSGRIKEMRYKLRDHLVTLKTPGNWDHIVQQCGMFSFTGLNSEMAQRLEKKHAVYITGNGRASIAGLNEGNVEYVAKAIDEVVRHFQEQSKL
ncbi:aspartate transaminase AAT2 SCDLUD_003978 [Saccharomycodes ludwigii]|uniref:aspartate transaminase AAT2 n=1 Tax=Saccharomycodes ludwigii TaxID=36035 RepID=UPI001E89E791|nr:hypothetical protein SCDLUD_003978 [Saccharomycodes ludwigii]KAH3899693.1 hypothetical protein SCDLUD_003978 [Saccharomycodes ludwigii]